MSEHIAITIPGKDVLTETNQNNFIFHSDYNTFKILYQGSASVNLTSGSNIYTVAHNAPTTPPSLAIFVKFPDGYVTPLAFNNVKSYNNAFLQSDGHSINTTWWDSTNISLYVAGVGTGYTITIAWYAFEQPL